MFSAWLTCLLIMWRSFLVSFENVFDESWVLHRYNVMDCAVVMLLTLKSWSAIEGVFLTGIHTCSYCFVFSCGCVVSCWLLKTGFSIWKVWAKICRWENVLRQCFIGRVCRAVVNPRLHSLLCLLLSPGTLGPTWLRRVKWLPASMMIVTHRPQHRALVQEWVNTQWVGSEVDFGCRMFLCLELGGTIAMICNSSWLGAVFVQFHKLRNSKIL
jgi:hypothetical protein